MQVFYDEYDEAQLTLNFQTRLTLSFAVAPDVLRYSQHTHALNRGRQISYEASFRQPLWRSLNLTVGVGHYDLSDIFQGSYWAWSGGVELGLRGLQLSLSRFGTDDAAWRMFGAQTANARWALTAAWRF